MIGARALRKYRSIPYSAEYPYAPCTWIARCAARNAHSVACHFASDVSRVLRRPSFFIHAACMTSSFDVSYPSTISAIMSWTNWYLPIGCPNVSRSRAYSTDFSRHARMTPHAPAATVKRPWSRPCMAISKPWPSSPTRFSAGTSTFSKKSSPVEPAQMPSLFSVSAVVNPRIPRSTTKAEMPLCFADGSLFAKTRAWSATFAYEIQFLEPFRTYVSPSRRALDFIEATSEPAAGSVRPKQAIFSPRAWGTSQRCFCSSVAYLSSASEFRPTCTETRVRNAASPRSISSHASASQTKSSPAPPYSSGTTMPSRPSSAMPSITFRSSRCAMSFSTAFGSMRSSTNSRTVSWINRCSSVRSKSMAESLWKRIAELLLAIESFELERLELDVSPEFKRVTTVVHLHGAGQEGLGEDVTYGAPEQDAFQREGPGLPLAGSRTLGEFSRLLDTLELFPEEPAMPAYRDYRRWALESAALDLALRQAGVSLAEALGREPKPVTFVSSMRLGEPATIEPLARWLDLYPALRFKLDPTSTWDDALVSALVETRAVDTLDLKGVYEGTPVDQAGDPTLYA